MTSKTDILIKTAGRMAATLLLALAAMICLPVGAQSDNVLISNRPLPDKSGALNCGGKAVVHIFSSLPDLVVTVDAKQKTQSSVAAPVQESGMYKYVVEFTLAEGTTRQPRIAILRKGSAAMTYVTPVLRANNVTAFLVEAPTFPIMLNTQEGANACDNGYICLDVTTTLQGLKVNVSQELQPKVATKYYSETGSYRHTVTMSHSVLSNMRKQLEEKRTEMQELDKELTSNPELATDEKWQELDKLTAQVDEMEGIIENVSNVGFSTDESNEVAVNIADMKNAERRNFVIIGLAQKDTVHVGPYEDCLAQAVIAYNNRKYGTAVNLYTSARDYAEGDPVKTAICDERMQQMQVLADLMIYATGAYKTMINELKESGKTRLDYKKVEECFNVAIANFQKLMESTGDSWYANTIKKLKENFANLPRVIEGTLKTTKKSGGYITHKVAPECQIYGVEKMYATLKPKEVMNLACTGKLKQVGTTNSEGLFHLELPRDTYAALFFMPSAASGVESPYTESISTQLFHQKKDIIVKK